MIGSLIALPIAPANTCRRTKRPTHAIGANDHAGATREQVQRHGRWTNIASIDPYYRCDRLSPHAGAARPMSSVVHPSLYSEAGEQ